MPITSPLPGSIAHATQAVFDALTASSSDAERDPDSRNPDADEHDLGDEIGRLTIWDQEHGARSGSLDFELEDIPNLRDRVLSLLRNLSGEKRHLSNIARR